jgi:hypothetical protein
VINVAKLLTANGTYSRVSASGLVGAGGMLSLVTGGTTTKCTSSGSGTGCLGPNVSASVESNAYNGLAAFVPSTKTNSIGLACLYNEGMRGLCKAGAIVLGGSTVNKLEVIEPVVTLNCPSEGYRTVSGSSEYIVNHVTIVGLEGHGLGKSFPNVGILLGTIGLTGSGSVIFNIYGKAVGRHRHHRVQSYTVGACSKINLTSAKCIAISIHNNCGEIACEGVGTFLGNSEGICLTLGEFAVSEN